MSGFPEKPLCLLTPLHPLFKTVRHKRKKLFHRLLIDQQIVYQLIGLKFR
jgi:hypothetical protein